MLNKILIIRFSSIGDIVLTSPVIRCIKATYPNSEIHYLTKEQYSSIVQFNPMVDKIWTIKDSIREVLGDLKLEKFDFVVDLHKNLRSIPLRMLLGKKSGSYSKANFAKFLMVRLKYNRLPKTHIVDKYFQAVREIDVFNDEKGLDFFLDLSNEITIKKDYPILENGFILLVLGGHQKTKQFPENKLIDLVSKINSPIVLLGGKDEFEKGEAIRSGSDKDIINLCGKYSVLQSAAIVKDADLVFTNDTGFMHIAAALKQRIISVWGSTIPEFGMTPYYPDEKDKYLSEIFEIKGLKCRPCHKLGYDKCPKGHFDCMNKINTEEIAKRINS